MPSSTSLLICDSPALPWECTSREGRRSEGQAAASTLLPFHSLDCKLVFQEESEAWPGPAFADIGPSLVRFRS
jgi:hypothetical protein